MFLTSMQRTARELGLDPRWRAIPADVQRIDERFDVVLDEIAKLPEVDRQLTIASTVTSRRPDGRRQAELTFVLLRRPGVIIIFLLVLLNVVGLVIYLWLYPSLFPLFL